MLGSGRGGFAEKVQRREKESGAEWWKKKWGRVAVDSQRVCLHCRPSLVGNSFAEDDVVRVSVEVSGCMSVGGVMRCYLPFRCLESVAKEGKHGSATRRCLCPKGRHSERCLRISRARRHLLQNEHRRKARHVSASTTIGSKARGGRHTVERPHLARWEGIGTEVSAGRVWCDSFVRCEGARHHPIDARPPGEKRRCSSPVNRTASSMRSAHGIRGSASSSEGRRTTLGRTEGVMVAFEQLATHLLGRTNVAGMIGILEKNACDGDGYRRFVLIEMSGGGCSRALC